LRDDVVTARCGVQIGPHRIDPPFLLAPMAGVSEMPFRVLALELGAGLATTELISASGIKYKNRRTRQYMTFDRQKERPYSIQLFGGQPDVMAEAARAAWEHGADIIDINMGCPVRKVTGTGAGSALSCDPPRAADIIRAMRAAVDDKVPITAKIRAGWDEKSINCVEMAKTLEDAGCAALALHARTRAAGYSGTANWDLIGHVKQAVKMPVIGNGDVLSWADARRMRQHTGCDAVMIGRGALGNPWVFASARAGQDLPPPTPTERLALIRRHFVEHRAFHETLDDEEERRLLRTPPVLMATKTFRQHLVWYSRGLVGGKEFRKSVLTLEEPTQVEDRIEEFFGAAPLDVDVPAFHAGDDGASGAGGDDEGDGVDYKQAFG
jgi:nifR3 family TIM-barrel protein